MKKLWVLTLATLMFALPPLAEAKRLGGGGSLGRQSSNVTQRQATPPPAPARQQNAAQQTTTPPPAKKPWGAMLGGLAAGLGLAWLANSLGFGEAFGNILLIMLLVGAALAAWRMFSRKKINQQTQFATPSGAPYSSYKPEKVGNDASARPWEQQNGASSAVINTTSTPSALSGSQTWGIPADFDTEGFLRAAKQNFMLLQSAWDRGDVTTLRSMMTDEMLQEVRQQLSERQEEEQKGAAPNVTEIEGLQAQLLGIEDQGDVYLASVEFSGMNREEPDAGLSPFREVWNMTKPKDGKGGWLVAGLQTLA